MIYSAIGIMSGSSLDGLDIVHTELLESGGKWHYEINAAKCYEYSNEMQIRLRDANKLSALEYHLLHVEFGQFIGQKINEFIHENSLEHKIHLISSHGQTVFHSPDKKMTAQLGDGASIAAETNLPVVSDLRNMDIAFGGHGAPIVPIGEKLLLNEYDSFLNIGGIANISFKKSDQYIAFDICPANRVLNMLVNEIHLSYDEGGKIATKGMVNESLLKQLNNLDFYKLSYPKSLSNNFGNDQIYPLIKSAELSIEDALRTYIEHISQQIYKSFLLAGYGTENVGQTSSILITGGGAFNHCLIENISEQLKKLSIKIVVADDELAMYKEALIMALIGVLRWREEPNVLSSVTGAAKNSIGGALWLGG